jgi:predicted HicB family RNase H-like nuclease
MKRNLLSHKGYTAAAEVDFDDGLIHGRVLGIRDVVTFEGTTTKAARQDFEAAVEDYLAQCRDEGKEPERPFSGQFNLRIPRELHQRVVEAAERHGLSLNAFVESTLQHAVPGRSGLDDLSAARDEAQIPKARPSKASAVGRQATRIARGQARRGRP